METKGGEAMFDPICGKPVTPSALHTAEYKRRTYFFCSCQCREGFKRWAEGLRMKDLARLGALFANEKVRWGVA